jgi:hypothetical protein
MTTVEPDFNPACSITRGSVAFAMTGRANGSTDRAAIGTRGVRAVMTGVR